VENEQRTYGLAEWAAALRVRRTEEELALAAAAREREAARRSSPQEPASAKAADEVRVRKNVRKADRESIEVERVPLSGEAADRRGAPVPEAEWGLTTYRG
jgi:hypothetical protein